MTETPDTGPEPKKSSDPAPSAQGAPDDGLELARDIADSYRGRAPKQAPRRASRSGPVPAKRASRDDPDSVANFLGKLISDQGWEDNLSAQRVFTDWARIVGSEVAQHCAVIGYEDGQVEVEADSTAWSTQLRLLAPRIVAKLNQELGQGSVVRLDIHGPKGPTWVRGKRSLRNSRGPRDTYG